MEISEIRAKRDKAQEEISAIVQKLKDETGVCIESVEVSFEMTQKLGDRGFDSISISYGYETTIKMGI